MNEPFQPTFQQQQTTEVLAEIVALRERVGSIREHFPRIDPAELEQVDTALLRFGELIGKEMETIISASKVRGNSAAFNEFLTRVKTGEVVACAIDAIVRRCGWTVGSSKVQGCISAVQSLERIYNLDGCGAALEAALRINTDAWGQTPQTVQAVMLEGVAIFHHRFGDRIDRKVVVERLKQFRDPQTKFTGPKGLREWANIIGLRNRSNTVPENVSEAVRDAFNYGRKTANQI